MTGDIPEPAGSRNEALRRLRDYCAAVHTVYEPEGDEPEGLIVDTANDYSAFNAGVSTAIPAHHLLLADLERIAGAYRPTTKEMQS